MGTEGRDPGAFFDRAAGRYARERYGPAARPFRRAFFGTRLALAARALEGLPPGALVLDAGCGPAPLAAKLRSRGVRLVGVDLAPAMLERAREAGALPVRGDAAALPVRDASADAVLLLGVTTYAPDPAPLLREAARALRPGGILVVTSTNAAAPDTLARAALRPFARLLRGEDGSVLASGLPVRAHAPAAFADSIRAAGLEVLSSRGHNYTLFPFGFLIEVPSVALSRAAEAGRLPAGLASDTLFVARKPGGTPPAPPPRPPRPVPVLRAIARLNVGGPAMHVALLSEGLDRRGFRTTLAAGRCEPGEADMADFARERGVEPVIVPALGRSVSPVADLRSFADLLSLVRRTRPAVVHTHTAKAGALGRLAATLSGVPVRVHTFHGHVFHGYFGSAGSWLVLLAERLLGFLSHRVLAVSREVARDLGEAYGVVPAGKIEVVPLGLDLGPFARAGAGEGRGQLRAEIGAEEGDLLVGVVGRLVPVKGHAFLLEAAVEVLREIPQARFVIVGSGPLEEPLRARARLLGIDRRCHFLGWRRDTPRVYADLDAVALTSLNEGTPVALIEAAAAGVPVVARSVGGVASALEGVEDAMLVPPEAPPAGFAASLAVALRAVRGPRRPNQSVVRRFSVERLCDDVERIYREELVRAGRGRR